METVIVKIDGISCMGCVNTLTRVLSALPGVEGAVVDKDQAQATITFDPAQVQLARFKSAIEDAGYDVAA
ncbi:MAG: heavy-metal-associated domain-containing protein [Paludibacterium sp.]|uniref:heavy-metal-associated domain-containing protein n=1 Tax=Paludibacterium sp. TaxID=1917523 RepID=UPI0025DACA49|nr:cation transporter [Paludibacterium sp.]MBV8046526.1 heavy-metal-associated domain-containing protein [Paludibacterium sp.]MBV8649507.1 heavy-metal-associated domain-containing protein [Paludibacterium sp.]